MRLLKLALVIWLSTGVSSQVNKEVEMRDEKPEILSSLRHLEKRTSMPQMGLLATVESLS